MAVRVTVDEVRAIIETSLSDTIILDSMIDTANLYINTHLLGVGHTEEMLAKIELYLSAHFVAITEEGGTLQSSKMGDAEDEWETDYYKAGLNSTRYGQAAITLDTSDTLLGIGSGVLKAQFRVV